MLYGISHYWFIAVSVTAFCPCLLFQINNPLTNIIDALRTLLAQVRDLLNQLLQTGQNLLNNITDTVKAALDSIAKLTDGVIQGLLTGNVTDLLNAIANTTGNSSCITNARNSVPSLVQNGEYQQSLTVEYRGVPYVAVH